MNPDAHALSDLARSLMASEKGLLAMDESNPTCNARFARLAIEQTEDARRTYRELLVSAPGLGEYISGAILYDETIRSTLENGKPFVQTVVDAGIIPGVKVDRGAKPMAGFPGEQVTEGLDGLAERLAEYAAMGARFAKWRAVFSIGPGTPSRACINANALILARYAASCQEAGLVPIVEPEILMAGSHDLQRSMEISEHVLRTVFNTLSCQGVQLEGLLLKPAMVLPGNDAPVQSSAEEVAEATIKCLLRTVPAAVPGIAFLSGGQASELASARLNAINLAAGFDMPWTLTFSFSRALQQSALERWSGKKANAEAAQQLLLHRARCNQAARRGEYDAAMEARPR